MAGIDEATAREALGLASHKLPIFPPSSFPAQEDSEYAAAH